MSKRGKKSKRKKQMSEAQLEANRENAKKSPGPKTEEGKNRSKYNATKHGLRAATVILPWEDEAEYKVHCNIVLDHIRPRDALEYKLAMRIAQNEWRQNRAGSFECEVIQMSDCRTEMLEELLKITMYESRLQRNSDRVLTTIQRLRQTEAAEAKQAEPAKQFVPEAPPPVNDLFGGACFRTQMPREKDAGRRWREHLEDIAMSVRDLPDPRLNLGTGHNTPRGARPESRPARPASPSYSLSIMSPDAVSELVRKVEKAFEERDSADEMGSFDPNKPRFDENGRALDRDGSLLPRWSSVPIDVEAIMREQEEERRLENQGH